MSTNLYWRPVPNTPEGNRLGDQLKYVICQEVFGHDGSLNSGWVTVDRTMIPFLRGVVSASGGGADAGLRADALELIELIHDHSAVQLSTSS
jgi:hypothetical protein